MLFEALQLGATRSDITNDVKSGHCTLLDQPQRDPETGERLAKQQRIDPPVELPQSEQQNPSGDGASVPTIASVESSVPNSEPSSVQGCQTEKSEKSRRYKKLIFPSPNWMASPSSLLKEPWEKLEDS